MPLSPLAAFRSTSVLKSTARRDAAKPLGAYVVTGGLSIFRSPHLASMTISYTKSGKREPGSGLWEGRTAARAGPLRGPSEPFQRMGEARSGLTPHDLGGD